MNPTPDAASRQPDHTWPLQSTDSPNTGTAHVFLAPGHEFVRYPLLMVEGFPGSHPLSYLLAVMDQHRWMDALLGLGYDVILLGLDQGADRIQANAGLVEAAVHKLHGLTEAPLVLAGMSMGGLVLRYALTRMEHQGRVHRCAVMLTLDTPHGGAYTSLAAQWFAQHFAAVDDGLKSLAALLDSPANQQFMLQWLQGQRVQASPLRKQFFDELRALGDYPQHCQRWAIASGRGSGGSNLRAHQRVLDWVDARHDHTAMLWTQGDGDQPVPLARGRCAGVELPALSLAGEVNREGVPGGQGRNFRLAADAAARIGGASVGLLTPVDGVVPTLSALGLPADLDPLAPIPPEGAKGCPFHAYRYQASDHPHLYFDADTAAWLLQRLGRAERLAFVDPAFDPHDLAFQKHPYPVYARLRQRQTPVLWVERYQAWWLFAEGDVRRVLQDPTGFVKKLDPEPAPPARIAPFDVDDYLGLGVFASDPPLHAELRAHLGPLFEQAIASAATVAEQEAQRCLTAMLGEPPAAGGRIELITAYALPLPSRVLFRLMGVPEAHIDLLVGWVTAAVAAHDITQSAGVRLGGGTAAMALAAYFQGLLRAPLAARPVTLLERLAASAQDGGLALDKVQASVVSIAIAGYLSTTFLIGTGLQHLLANPQAARTLLHGNAAAQSAVIEELLRLDAPAQIVDRVAAQDVQLGGATIRSGDALMLVLGAANRDPRAFDDPDALRPGRPVEPGHLSFGAGIHHCIGAPLARVVAPIALRALLGLRGLRLAGQVQWQADPYLRGPTSLPVAWG